MLIATNMKEPQHVYLVARDLYDLFMQEAVTSTDLQKIIDHALHLESRTAIYREAWISGVTWSIIQSKIIHEIVEKIVEKQSNN